MDWHQAITRTNDDKDLGPNGLITDVNFALTGELWDVYCEDFGENWQLYNGTAPYHNHQLSVFYNNLNRMWQLWFKVKRNTI